MLASLFTLLVVVNLSVHHLLKNEAGRVPLLPMPAVRHRAPNTLYCAVYCTLGSDHCAVACRYVGTVMLLVVFGLEAFLYHSVLTTYLRIIKESNSWVYIFLGLLVLISYTGLVRSVASVLH